MKDGRVYNTQLDSLSIVWVANFSSRLSSSRSFLCILKVMSARVSGSRSCLRFSGLFGEYGRAMPFWNKNSPHSSPAQRLRIWGNPEVTSVPQPLHPKAVRSMLHLLCGTSESGIWWLHTVGRDFALKRSWIHFTKFRFSRSPTQILKIWPDKFCASLF